MQRGYFGYAGHMLEISQIDAIAAEVGRALLPAGAVVDAHSRPASGEDGEEQLWVRMVITDNAIDRINGENALNTIYELQQRLMAEGENRFAVVQFVSDTETAANSRS